MANRHIDNLTHNSIRHLRQASIALVLPACISPSEPTQGYSPPPFYHNPEFLGTQKFRDIQGEDSFGCGMRIDGSIQCFGADGNLGRTHPPAGHFSEMDLSHTGGCARKEDRRWTCWGFKAGSEDWLFGGSQWPTSPIHSLDLGSLGACALLSSGSPVCWGEEPWNKLPPGPYSDIEVSNSGLSFCAIRSDTRMVECMSYDGPVREKYQLSGAYTHISWEGDLLAGLRVDGEVVVVGDNRSGIQVPPMTGIGYQSLEVHRSSAYVLTDSGNVEIFPEPLRSGKMYSVPQWTYVQVAALSGGFCARSDTGQVACAGWLDWIPEAL